MASGIIYASSPLDNQAPGFLSPVLEEADTLYSPSGSSGVCGRSGNCLTAEGAVCQYESGQGRKRKKKREKKKEMKQ